MEPNRCNIMLPPASRRAPLLLRLLVPATLAAVSAGARPATAQQYVVEDAAVVEYRACQIEAWHGERESWMEPGCQPLRNLELTVGAGFLADGDGARETGS